MMPILVIYCLDSDIEVVERPGETSETPEPECKQSLDENESEKTET